MEAVFTYIMMISVYLFWFFPKWNNDRSFLLKTIFYIYICMIIEVTLLPIDFSAGIHLPHSGILQYGNFEPFVDLLKNRPLAKPEIFLNILMMIPFGILYPIAFDKKFIKTIISVFMLSLVIEATQLFMAAFMVGSRMFDITDLITNTLGGLLGFKLITIVLHLNKTKS